jgi:hypothetical protein
MTEYPSKTESNKYIGAPTTVPLAVKLKTFGFTDWSKCHIVSQ